MSDFPNDAVTSLQNGANDNSKPKKIRHRQWRGATLGLLGGVVGLIAGRLGQLYPAFDVFAQFGAQFMMVSLGFTFAIFFSRFKAILGIAIAIGLLALYGAWPHLVSTPLLKGPFTLQVGEKSLRIAHFNTFKNNADFDAITKEVLRLDADVVSLVEVSPEKMAAIGPKLKAAYPHQFICKVEYCDLAIISKFPIIAGDGDGVWVGAPFVRVNLGGEMSGVTVVGVHTTRFPHSRAQLKQVNELLKELQSTSGDLIVMGDFNATPYSRITTTFEKGADVTRLTDLPTWPTHLELPQLAIDHAFASKNFRVIGNQQIGEAAGSDHYPIVLTLARKVTQ